MAKSRALVAILMGSDSDYKTMKDAEKALQEMRVPFEVSIVSAHRTPKELARYAEKAEQRGIKVFIAGAGGAAHLPGMIAAYSSLPVIGVPVVQGMLKGLDALLSVVQMPKGVPVAAVAIGNAYNAGLLAAQILGVKNLVPYKKKLRKIVLDKKLKSKNFFAVKKLK